MSTGECARALALHPIIPALHLVVRKLRIGAVLAGTPPLDHEITRPIESRVRYAHTEGARNHGLPK